MKIPVLATIAIAVSAAAYAQSDQERAWSPPRTSWGDPLIEGPYTNKDEYGTPLERPDEFAGKRLEDFGPAEMAALRAERQQRALETAASIGGTAEEDTGAGPPHWYEHLEAENSQPWFVIEPADGKIPALTEAARQRQEAQREARSKRAAPDSYTDMSDYERCISLGMPGSMMPGVYGSVYEITQAPGFVAIRHEMIHETRVIDLAGREHVDEGVRTYMGDAIGRWDGDTLVVETTNFKGATGIGLNGNGLPTTTAIRLTERFTRVADDQVDYEVTVDDPGLYTAPFTIAMPLTTQPGYRVLPYECHEGNHAVPNILSAARAEEAAAAK